MSGWHHQVLSLASLPGWTTPASDHKAYILCERYIFSRVDVTRFSARLYRVGPFLYFIQTKRIKEDFWEKTGKLTAKPEEITTNPEEFRNLQEKAEKQRKIRKKPKMSLQGSRTNLLKRFGRNRRAKAHQSNMSLQGFEPRFRGFFEQNLRSRASCPLDYRPVSVLNETK